MLKPVKIKSTSLAPIQLVIQKVTYEFRTYHDLECAVVSTNPKKMFHYAERVYDWRGRMYKNKEATNG